MSEVLEDFKEQWASEVDGIDGAAREEQELTELVNHLENSSRDFRMERSGEKTRVMANSGFTFKIKIKYQKLKSW